MADAPSTTEADGPTLVPTRGTEKRFLLDVFITKNERISEQAFETVFACLLLFTLAKEEISQHFVLLYQMPYLNSIVFPAGFW